jgi:hypothetical protein
MRPIGKDLGREPMERPVEMEVCEAREVGDREELWGKVQKEDDV